MRVPESAQMERRGINHISEVCTEMGFIWRETSNTDVGFDGEIELAAGGIATGQIIKVQSKAGKSYIKNESKSHERFDFYPDANHLEYWQRANNPVILVVYDPDNNTAYWADVKKYIRAHPKVLTDRPHKITLDKIHNCFTPESADALWAMFGPDYQEVESDYRKHVTDRYGKLTLYSVTSDAPLAVDLERVFVKLTATQRRRTVGREVDLADRFGDEQDDLLSELAHSPIRPFAHSPITEEVTVTLSVNDAFRAHPFLSIVGAPGAGKTTLLKYLALTFARHQAQERLELGEERLPVFIALRDFNRFLDNAEQRGELLDLGPPLLPRFLNAHLQEIAPHLNLPDDFFARQLDEGRCAVLLDGLDEVADPLKRARVAEAVAAFVRHYQGNRFVLTSRPRGYEGEARQRLASLCADCTIRDFDDDDMAEFARSWYTAVTIDQLGDHPTARDTTAARADDLLQAIRADERVKALAHNPLLLSVLAMVHQRGVGLPQRRAELYDELTDMLLGYWDQTKGGAAARELATYGHLTRSEKRALLEPVAFWFHERGEQGLEANKNELVEVIARQFAETFGDDERKARSRAELFLRVIDERAGLLVERETGVYAFAHLTFQEYLAARAIADRDDYIDYSLSRLHDPWWREVLLLEVGHLSDVRHFGRRARKLTSDLIRAIRQAGSWLEDVLKRDLLFAVRGLLDTGPLGVDDDLRQGLLDELLALWHTTPYEPQRREVVDLFSYALPTVEGVRIRAELLHCLMDGDRMLRLRALEALGQMGRVVATEEVVKHLLALTTDVDADIRSAATRVLGQMGEAAATTETLERLLARIQDENRHVRSAAAAALGAIGKAVPAAVERLLALTEDVNVDVRYVAVQALGQMGETAATAEVIERLLVLTTGADVDVRSWAALSLGQMGEAAGAMEWLLMLTTNTDANVRSTAAWVLGWTGDAAAEVAERLLALTNDEAPEVRWGAVEGLGLMGKAAATTETVERILAMTADGAAQVRSTAAWALGRMGEVAGTAKVVERLLDLATDAATGVRSMAAWAFGEIGEAAATAAVVERLLALMAESNMWLLQRFAGTDTGVCAAAAWALGRIDDTKARVDILVQLTEFWQGQLKNTEYCTFGSQSGRACAFAYEELRRIAEQRGR